VSRYLFAQGANGTVSDQRDGGGGDVLVDREGTAAGLVPASGGRTAHPNMPIPPPGVDVDANIGITHIELSLSDWETAVSIWTYRVREGGLWDYTLLGLRYEDFGNFNYGATGRVLVHGGTLERAAGAVQMLSGTSNPRWGTPLGIRPFGDQPIDNFWIRQGIRYYESSLI